MVTPLPLNLLEILLPPLSFLCPSAAEVGHQEGERERERERETLTLRPHLTSPQVSPLQVLLLLRLMLVRPSVPPSRRPMMVWL